MNCRPGDLAIIISAKDSRNLGRVVDVIQLAPPQSFLFPCAKHRCCPRPPEAMGAEWLVKVRNGALDSSSCEYAVIEDRKLMPIRPDGETMNQSTEVKANA